MGDLMRQAFGLVVVFVALWAAGCSGSNVNRYTQAQLNAIETRVVDAGLDETFQAASNALFDAGYTISMSDRAGGIITGYQGKDNTAARIWVSPLIQDTRFIASIQMRSSGARTTDVRIKTSRNGEPYVNEKAINELWTLMQRQVLMKEPTAAGPIGNPGGSTSVSRASRPSASAERQLTGTARTSDEVDGAGWITGKP